MFANLEDLVFPLMNICKFTSDVLGVARFLLIFIDNDMFFLLYMI